MPEPVFPAIEEAAAGPRPIQAVGTSTAALVGATEFGPTRPTPVASLAEYEALFGGGVADLGHMRHAVAGFFENGGRQAVIARIVGDGGPLTAADYQGVAPDGGEPTGLAALELDDYRDVALVYAPDAHAVPGLVPLIVDHCERLHFRFAVIDAPRGAAADFEPLGAWDSSFAAVYHPWIQVLDPDTGAHRLTPPGGHVLGVYARTDQERGVAKAPANAVLSGAVGLESRVTSRQQADLAARGVNPIREFPGRGILVWGARTHSASLDFRYVNVRRLFIYLERSIYEGTGWVVFEPNDERLWARVRDTVRQFLRAQWQAGAVMGRTERDAFFVNCDRTTMTQADLENGRLVCEIGVAPLRPAEFVIFRIGQWTSDHPPP
jgi:phage tail sheath protein FI